MYAWWALVAVVSIGAFPNVDAQIGAQVSTCANTRCSYGYQCVLVEPTNCVGCATVPRCVQQECNTACTLPCGFYQRCVLVATNCCPTATCRAPPTTTTTTTPRYPYPTTTPRYPTFSTPRYPFPTTTPRYPTFTLFPPFTFPQFTLPPFFTFRPG